MGGRRVRYMAALFSLSEHDDLGAGQRARPRKTKLVRVTAADDRVVCTHCEVAESTLARMRGLMGRERLAPGHGMLINGTASIQMLFMRFPIDVVFLRRDKAIVGISHHVKPWRGIAGARGASAALELPAGAAKSYDLQVGDVLSLIPVPGSSVA
jgi:uncharacterized membrane protein (UPF0127 family)